MNVSQEGHKPAEDMEESMANILLPEAFVQWNRLRIKHLVCQNLEPQAVLDVWIKSPAKMVLNSQDSEISGCSSFQAESLFMVPEFHLLGTHLPTHVLQSTGGILTLDSPREKTRRLYSIKNKKERTR